MKNLTIILFSLIVTVLCIYPWQELTTTGGLGFIRNTIGWSLIVALTATLVYRSLKVQQYSIPNFWLIGLLGCFVANLPFFLTSSEYAQNSFWLPLGLLFSWLFLLSLVNSQTFYLNSRFALYLVLFVCTAQIMVALWQLFHSYMMESTSGVTEHKLPQVRGTFTQRNLYASFTATALIVAIYLFPAKRILKVGNSSVSMSRLLLLFIFLGSFTLLLTDSRVGIYSFILGLILICFGFRHSWRKKLLKPLGMVAAATLISQIMISTVYENKTKDFSKTTSRQVIYYTSIEAIKDAPILGHGLGSFEKVYLEQLGELSNNGIMSYQDLQGRPENLSHPHNELLYWGVQGGLVSILGLLIMAFSVLSLFRGPRLNKALTYLALLLPISFHLMVELPFYISTVHLIVYILLIAYVVTTIDSFKNYFINVNNKMTPRVITGVIGAVLILALTMNTYSLFKAVKFERALNPDIKDLDRAVITMGWSDTYQSLRLRHEANRAAKLGVLEPQVDYLNWLEEQINLTPRLNYYFNLYAVHRYLGNNEKANYYYDEIKRLFIGVREAESWLEVNGKLEI